jgi:GAF domain-containing protein
MQYRWSMTNREIAEFQQDALQLIASYVRGHRSDPAGTKIFANLLVEDGADVVVVARDHEHRLAGVRYPKTSLVAWDTIQSGEMAVIGDIEREAPGSVRSRKYRSIMVLPIMNEGRVLGAVSVDSTKPHHFDLDCETLQRYLAPYVCLLGWTLIRNRVPSLQSPKGGTP